MAKMHAQQLADLEGLVTKGKLLAQTVNTQGWKKVLEPEFMKMRKKAYDQMTKADTLQELYKARAALEFIDTIISNPHTGKESIIEDFIREGREAAKILAKQKDNK